jgi:sialate O-acetylesterase
MKKTTLLFSILITHQLMAQLRLPSFISDNMVIQQNVANRVWGWAQPDKMVHVNFGGNNYQTYADNNGNWSLFLDPMKAGKAGTMTIQSEKEQLQVNNLLCGEVWVCSGQSNMEWMMSLCNETYRKEISEAGNDNIRFMVAERAVAVQPQTDMKLSKKWSPIDSNTIKDCSAVAYWYAKTLQQKLNVPVGLVVTSWGGTQAQAWTSIEGLHDFPNYTSVFHEKVRNVDVAHIQEKKNSLKRKYDNEVMQSYTNGNQYLLLDYDDSRWETVHLPGQWEDAGYPMLDGLAYYRVVFDVPKMMAGKAAVLNLPAIDDKDSSYINGVFLGTTNQWDALRSYTIPADVLHEGKNVLVMKIEDFGGGGGLANLESHFNIKSNGQQINLSGKAKFKVEAVLEDVTGGNGAIEQQPTVIYNAMIAPLEPLTVKGVIWYQGESNADRPMEYRTLFPAMINDWRNHWHQNQLPFLFVQLSSFGPLRTEPVESDWAALREAQAMTLSLPQTGMAVTIDVGDPDNIHPQRKKEVGERLAAQAMNLCYGNDHQISGGPQFKKYTIKGNKIEIEFDLSGKGLMVKGTHLRQFAIAGKDRKFVWADAKIINNKIVVSNDKVNQPIAVRYAWADSPVEANLFNADGYPAVPFRTDDWPVK